MNLLQTQDFLKDLSDQHLMTEMQNPTGQVPQFLVLSELKRRKDMRNQNQSPPSRTVAEELTEPSQAAITQPGTVPAQAMPQGAQGAGIRSLGGQGMKEGGPVRMAAGERVPSPTGLNGYTEQQLRDLLSPQESVPAAPADNAFSRFLRGGRRENLPEQQWIPINPNTQSTVFGQPPRATIERALQNRMAATEPALGLSTEVRPYEPPQNTPMADPAALAYAQQVEGGPSPVGGLYDIAPRPERMPPQPVAQPAVSRPVMAAPAPVATQPTQMAMPAPVAIDRSNLNAISQRMMQERVDPNKAREDARNMALLQAGLAIAGGTSPHFAQNLAGAIPALQGYQTQVASIRREGRDELKAQFDLAKADVEAQYQQGTLTYHERSIAMQHIDNEMRNATTLQAHRESAGASIAAARIAASGRDRDLTYEQFSRLPPDEQRAYQQYKGRDPDARQNAQTDRVTNMYVQRIEGLNRNEAEQLRGVVLPDQRKAITERFAAERRQLDSLFRSRGVVIPEVEQPATGSFSGQTLPLVPNRR